MSDCGARVEQQYQIFDVLRRNSGIGRTTRRRLELPEGLLGPLGRLSVMQSLAQRLPEAVVTVRSGEIWKEILTMISGVIAQQRSCQHDGHASARAGLEFPHYRANTPFSRCLQRQALQNPT